MIESKVRFKVWFDDGAITPSWIVNSVNDNDFDHPFTGAINANSTEDQIIEIGEKYGVKSEEITFVD